MYMFIAIVFIVFIIICICIWFISTLKNRTYYTYHSCLCICRGGGRYGKYN